MDAKVFVLTTDEKIADVIDKAYDVIVKTEMLTRTNGYETLEFKIPFNYPKRDLLFNERRLEVEGRHYVIKLIDDSKASKNVTTITCDATWYDLADGDLLDHRSTKKFTARAAIEEQLRGTGWTCGVCENEALHQFTLKERNTRLYNLRYIHNLFGGDMWFDTKHRTVNLYTSMGQKTNNIFKYNHNIADIKRTIDTRNLITQLTFIGKNNLTFASENGGHAYIENFEYYDKMGLPRAIKAYTLQDERFTNKSYMKWYAEQWLKERAFPIVTYQLTPSLIREAVQLGDYVYVIDSQLGLEKWLRILAMEENKSEPWKSKYILENVYSTMSDLLNDTNNATITGDVVDTQLASLSPFNLLLNSSGDDGMAYWQSVGFDIDPTTGDSGYNCFTTSSGGGTRTLSQTVYPRTKSSYTVSASFESPPGYVYSPKDEIGIEVTIQFDDGTSQTEFFSFFGAIENSIKNSENTVDQTGEEDV